MKTEWIRSKEKFEAKKAKQAAKPEEVKVVVNTLSPLTPVPAPEPKKEKPAEAPRPKPKVMEVVVSGPISFSLTVDWAGTLMGGQMNEAVIKEMFVKALSHMGRVR